MKIKLIRFSLVFYFLLAGFNPGISGSAADSNPDEDILTGNCTLKELMSHSFGEQYRSEYSTYLPDLEILGKLENRIYDCRITIVLGTWCSDSKEQVPRFLKILDVLNYRTDLLELICVDKSKTAGHIDISGLNIERVPTFIFYRESKEIGRIIETPVQRLEDDMFHILFNE